MFEHICNYKVEVINSNIANLVYINMDFNSPDILKIKTEKRQNSIDRLMDKISDEEYNETKEKLDIESKVSSFGTITPTMMTMSINATKYQDELDIYKSLMSFIDSNTNKSKVVPFNNLNNPDVIHRNNVVDLSNKVISKILLYTSLIASDGRIGPAKTLIIGRNLRDIDLSKIKDQYEIIYDDYIDPDKIILCRGSYLSSASDPGIILINDKENSNFYLKGTKDWDRQYGWFWVK